MANDILLQAGIQLNTSQAFRDISNFGRQAEKMFTLPLGKMGKSASEFEKSLGAANARVIAFGASAGIIFGVQRAISALVKSTIDLEKRLADINVIMNVNSKALANFGDNLFTVAKNTGSSFRQVSEAATELARQGLGAEETLKRTRDAMILARLSGLQAKDAVESLTATINSFSKTVLNSTQIINKFATVDAAFAVSSADLAEGLKRVGSTAQDTGVEIDSLIGLITAAQQITARGGAVIGNSFKTIFQRIQRPETLEMIHDLGVEVFDMSGEVASADKILQRLAQTYDTLTTAGKNQIVQLAAGVFQANIFRAILSDLASKNSIYAKSMQISTNATDEAIRRNEELNKTLSALLNRAVAGFTQVGAKIGELAIAPVLKDTLTVINTLLDKFQQIEGTAIGNTFENIFQGLGRFLSFPGLFGVGAVIGKLFYDAVIFTKDAAKSFLGINTLLDQQLQLQRLISSTLSSSPALVDSIVNKRISQLTIEERILATLRQQAGVTAAVSSASATVAAGLMGRGVRLGSQGGVKVSEGLPRFSAFKDSASRSRGIPNFAFRTGGLIPNFSLNPLFRNVLALRNQFSLLFNRKTGDILHIKTGGMRSEDSLRKKWSSEYMGNKDYQVGSLGSYFDKDFPSAEEKVTQQLLKQQSLFGGRIPRFSQFSDPISRKIGIPNFASRYSLGYGKFKPNVLGLKDLFKDPKGTLKRLPFRLAGGMGAYGMGAIYDKILKRDLEAQQFYSASKYLMGTGGVRTLKFGTDRIRDISSDLYDVTEGRLKPQRTYFGIGVPHDSEVNSLDGMYKNSLFNTIGQFNFNSQKNLIQDAFDFDNSTYNQNEQKSFYKYLEEPKILSKLLNKFKIGKYEEGEIEKQIAKIGPIRFLRVKNLMSGGDSLAISGGDLDFAQYGSPFLTRIKFRQPGKQTPNFSPFASAISREIASGVPSSSVRMGADPRLKSSFNPAGIGIYNTVDEPMGLSQGISRATKEGKNPKTYNIPNFAFFPDGTEFSIKDLERFKGSKKEWLDLVNELEKKGLSVDLTINDIQRNNKEKIKSKIKSAIVRFETSMFPRSFKGTKQSYPSPVAPAAGPPSVLRTSAQITGKEKVSIEELLKRGRIARGMSQTDIPTSTQRSLERAEQVKIQNAQEELKQAEMDRERLRQQENRVKQQATAEHWREQQRIRLEEVRNKEIKLQQHVLGELRTQQQSGIREREMMAMGITGLRGLSGDKRKAALEARLGRKTTLGGRFNFGLGNLSPSKILNNRNFRRFGFMSAMMLPMISESFIDMIDTETKGGRIKASLARAPAEVAMNAMAGSIFGGKGIAVGTALGLGTAGYRTYKETQTDIPEFEQQARTASQTLTERNDAIQKFLTINERLLQATHGEIEMSPNEFLKQEKERSQIFEKFNSNQKEKILRAMAAGDDKELNEILSDIQKKASQRSDIYNLGRDLTYYAEKGLGSTDMVQKENLERMYDKFLGMVQASPLGKQIVSDRTFATEFAKSISGKTYEQGFASIVEKMDLGSELQDYITSTFANVNKKKQKDEVTKKFINMLGGGERVLGEERPGFINHLISLEEARKKLSKANVESFYDFEQFSIDLQKNIDTITENVRNNDFWREWSNIHSEEKVNQLKRKQEDEQKRREGLESPLSLINKEKKSQLDILYKQRNDKVVNEIISPFAQEFNRFGLDLFKELRGNKVEAFQTSKDMVQGYDVLRKRFDNIDALFGNLEIREGEGRLDRISKVIEEFELLRKEIKNTEISKDPEIKKKFLEDLEEMANKFKESKGTLEIFDKQVEILSKEIEEEAKQKKELLKYEMGPKQWERLMQKSMFSSDYAREMVSIRNEKILYNDPELGLFRPGKDTFNSFVDSLRYDTQDLYRDLNEGAFEVGENLKSSFKGAFKEFANGTKSASEALRDFGISIFNKILDKTIDIAFNSFTGSIVSGIQTIGSSWFGKNSTPGGAQGGLVQAFSSGGPVKGGSGVKDDVPSVLSAGEYVINKKAVKKYGLNTLHYINSGRLKKFQGGGSASVLLKNQFLYDDELKPSSGKLDVDPNLSNFGLSDEENPQNQLRMNREAELARYLKEKEDYEQMKKDAMAAFKQEKKNRIYGAYISLGIGLAGAGIGAAAKSGASSQVPNLEKVAAEGNVRANQKLGNYYRSIGNYSKAQSYYRDAAIYKAVNNRDYGSVGQIMTRYGKAKGGIISYAGGGEGPGKDNVPAWLMGGEFVMKRQAVQKYGVDFMNRLNSGQVRKFAEGGIVPVGGRTTEGDSTIKLNENLLKLITSTENLTQIFEKSINGQPTTSVKQNENQSTPIINVYSTVNVSSTQSGEVKSNVSTKTEGTNDKKEKNNTDLGRQIEGVVLKVIIDQSRPGGLLYQQVH